MLKPIKYERTPMMVVMPERFAQTEKDVLCQAILTKTRAATIEAKDGRAIDPMTQVFQRFKADPKDAQAVCRNVLMAISRETGLSEKQRKEKLERFLDSYIDLVIESDHHNFPPGDTVYRGVPEYLPDGLSDMGGDEEIAPDKRHREKIRVIKKEIYRQTKPLLMEIFSQNLTKEQIVEKIAAFVHDQIHFDREREALATAEGQRSVALHEYLDAEAGVCRHHALYTQVLLQFCGLTSRLLKCDATSSARNRLSGHACNLVRLNNRWHVLDVTSPDQLTPTTHKTFLRPIAERSIDLNTKTYTWAFEKTNQFMKKMTRQYISKKKMYYRIRKND